MKSRLDELRLLPIGTSLLASIGVLLLTPLASCGGSSRGDFPQETGPVFGEDASVPDADRSCARQCSLDFRSVLSACDGSLVETCPPDLACGGASCVSPCEAMAAAQSSVGCEFYTQPPGTTNAAGSCYAAYVVNSWTSPISVDVSLGGERLDLSNAVYRFKPGTSELEPAPGEIPPDESVIVFLLDAPHTYTPEGYTTCPPGVTPATMRWPSPARTGRGTSFHVTTSAPASVATIYPFGGASSFFPTATLLLPTASWDTQHVVVQPWQRSAIIANVGGVPNVQIVASDDDTQVTILPTADILAADGVAGALRGHAATYTLGKGEFLQVGQNDELSGSLIEANKPIATFGGHGCMNVPSDVPACDTEQKQIPAFTQWGQEYVAVRYRGRTGDSESVPYRIVAAIDGTELSYDPAPPISAPTSMKAGEVATFSSAAPFVVRSQDANHPIYVAAYMTGGGGDGFNAVGDPEAVNLVPAGQYLDSYSFFADPTYDETSLVVVRAKSSSGVFEDVTLECAGGALTDWQPVGNSGKYEFRRVDLSRGRGPGETFPGGTCTSGLHKMKSNGPFTATIWGWGRTASYAYPGGMAQRKLVTASLNVH